MVLCLWAVFVPAGHFLSVLCESPSLNIIDTLTTPSPASPLSSNSWHPVNNSAAAVRVPQFPC
jgi:hypothetical protein